MYFFFYSYYLWKGKFNVLKLKFLWVKSLWQKAVSGLSHSNAPIKYTVCCVFSTSCVVVCWCCSLDTVQCTAGVLFTIKIMELPCVSALFMLLILDCEVLLQFHWAPGFQTCVGVYHCEPNFNFQQQIVFVNCNDYRQMSNKNDARQCDTIQCNTIKSDTLTIALLPAEWATQSE